MKKWELRTSITYTSSGNITSIGLDAGTYNKANQMATLTVSGTPRAATLTTPSGTRLKVKTGTTPYQLQMYDLDGHMLTETSAAASPVETDYAYMDGLPIAAIQPAAATISALHTDNIGTVQRATNAAKTTVWTCNYTPFGGCTPTATITMNFRFPGAYIDATGLLHIGYRDLNTTLGQWMEPDPIGLAGSFPGYPVATVNPYPYALNNPITNIDPWGLCANDDVMCQIAMRQAGLPQFAEPDTAQPSLGCELQSEGLKVLVCTGLATVDPLVWRSL